MNENRDQQIDAEELRQPHAGLADEGFADQAREAEAEQRQRQAGRHLVRHERQGQEAEQQRHGHAGGDRGKTPR